MKLDSSTVSCWAFRTSTDELVSAINEKKVEKPTVNSPVDCNNITREIRFNELRPAAAVFVLLFAENRSEELHTDTMLELRLDMV